MALRSSVRSYAKAMDSLGPEVYTDYQLTTLYSSMLFGDSLLSCGVRGGDYRFIREGQCGWMRFQARHLNRKGTSENRGFDEDALTGTAGSPRQSA